MNIAWWHRFSARTVVNTTAERRAFNLLPAQKRDFQMSTMTGGD